MATRTVKCAMVSYTDAVTRNVERVFRGTTHDFPQSVIDRYAGEKDIFLEEGVTELPIPTRTELFEIDPDTVTDEELKALVTSATMLEIVDLGSKYPGLQDRIEDAIGSVIDTRGVTVAPGTIDKETGASVTADGLTTVNPATEVDADGVRRQAPGVVPSTGTEALDAPVANLDGNDGNAEDDAEDDDEDITEAPDNELTPEDVVAHNPSFVVAYLGRNPEMAAEIAAAEDARPRGARTTVVRALAALAGARDAGDDGDDE